MKRWIAAFLGTVLSAALAAAAWAQTLTMAVYADTTSIDPHFYNSPPNLQISTHIFNRLIKRDANEKLVADLAESWKAIDDKTWEFKLRRGVKWHDGTPFTADDFLFTWERAPNVPGSPSTPGRFFLGKSIKKVDDHTLHIAAPTPYPLMANDMTVAHVISAKHGRNATTEDYNTGKSTIGTGPYKFKEWVKGDRAIVTRNPDYWGEKARWEQVVIKPIPSDAARVAALLSGSVDLIDFVPTEDAEKLKADPKLRVWGGPSNRILHFVPDVGRDLTPMVKSNDGKDIYPNPLRDWRVRKAISKAIDRNAIVQRVMQGSAVAAGQMIPPGAHGHNPDLKPEAFDPEGAKRLLAEARLPDGFRVTIHGPSGRYVNDTQVLETLAQMLARVGIKAEVQTVPMSVYFGRVGQGLYSLQLLGYGSDTGDGSSALINLLHSFWPKDGLGAVNRGRYSNRRVDDLADKGLVELDDAKREKMIHEAYAIAMQDVGTIPLYWQVNVWASKPGLRYETRLDDNTLAESVFKE